MFYGIIRVMFPETAHLSETVPHVDCLPRSIAELQQQFSANIYLETPPSGGELIIWDTQAFSYDQVQRFEGAQLPEQCLQKPLRIRPRQNELVLINTRRPHAICGFDSGKTREHAVVYRLQPVNRLLLVLILLLLVHMDVYL